MFGPSRARKETNVDDFDIPTCKACEDASDPEKLRAEIDRLRAENEKLRADGGGAIDALRIAPRAISAEADFDALTWTFKVMPDCQIGAGIYALVWMGPN